MIAYPRFLKLEEFSSQMKDAAVGALMHKLMSRLDIPQSSH